MKARSAVLPAVQGAAGLFLQLLGRSKRDAEHALEAIEYKATSVRLDERLPGHSDPATIRLISGKRYAWRRCANLLSKLDASSSTAMPGKIGSPWLYSNRELEQKNLHPYRCVLQSDQLVGTLNELPPAPDQFEIDVWNSLPPSREPRSKKPRRWCLACKSRNNRCNFNERCYKFIETVIVPPVPDLVPRGN